MVDLKVKQKKRDKIQRMVELKVKEGKSEKEAKKMVMKEQRLARKEKKTAAVEQIKEKINKELANEDSKVREKAIKRATAKYFSQLKKNKNPAAVLKQSAASFLEKNNGKLWCPKEEAWWDEECQSKFDELAFLAACWNIDLVKSPQNFADIYPEDCKAYFDMLAKKRFNSSSSKESKSGSKKGSKTKLEKAFEKKKAKSENSTKTDETLMKEVVADLAEGDRTSQLKNLKKVWKPTHKPFFDNECKEAFDKLTDTATKQSLDLDNNISDFKKFKRNNKKECERYFKLLNDKRDSYNQKQILKQERKDAAKEKENKAPLTPDNTTVNKKITFDEEGEAAAVAEKKSSKKKAKKEKLNIDETIKQVDEKLKNENKKKKKKDKKSKEELSA